MRYQEETEKKTDRRILTDKGGWYHRIVLRLFGRLIHGCVATIVGRSYECGQCDSETMHSIMDVSHRATMPRKY